MQSPYLSTKLRKQIHLKHTETLDPHSPLSPDRSCAWFPLTSTTAAVGIWKQTLWKSLMSLLKHSTSQKRKKRNLDFFTRVVRYWHRLHRDILAVPSLEMLKTRLDGALNNLVYWKVSLTTEGRLGQDDLPRPLWPKPLYDMILLSISE